MDGCQPRYKGAHSILPRIVLNADDDAPITFAAVGSANGRDDTAAVELPVRPAVAHERTADLSVDEQTVACRRLTGREANGPARVTSITKASADARTEGRLAMSGEPHQGRRRADMWEGWQEPAVEQTRAARAKSAGQHGDLRGAR